jgi:hypothetical protein
MSKGPIYGAVPIMHETVIAAAAIPQYRATMRGAIDTTTQGKTAQLPTAATSAYFGASNNLIDAVAGDLVHIIQQGRAIGTANAAILRGEKLIMDVNGRLGPAADAVGEQQVGVAEEAAAALGDFFAYTIRVFIR